MAKQNYDETGNMVAYFVFTFLSVFLVPYTLVSFSASSTPYSVQFRCLTLNSCLRASLTLWLRMPALHRSAWPYSQARKRLSSLAQAAKEVSMTLMTDTLLP